MGERILESPVHDRRKHLKKRTGEGHAARLRIKSDFVYFELTLPVRAGGIN